MKKALLAAAAGFAVVATGFSGVAEARCFRIGHHWSCGHHLRGPTAFMRQCGLPQTAAISK